MAFIRTHALPGDQKKNLKRKEPGSFLSVGAVEALILDALSELLHFAADEIDLANSFLFYGVTSISAIHISKRCSSEGVHLPVEAILSGWPLKDVLSSATLLPDSPLRPAKRPLHRRDYRRDDGAQEFEIQESHHLAHMKSSGLTEMQQMFNMDSERNPGNNVIIFYQTFESRHVQTLRNAWKQALEAEYIFRTDAFVDEKGTHNDHSRNCVFDWSTRDSLSNQELEDILQTPPKDSFATCKFIAATTTDQPDRTTIVWYVSHALIDGQSAKLLYKKVRAIAEGYTTQSGIPFMQVAQDLSRLQQQRASIHREFWCQQKKDHPHAKGQFEVSVSKAEMQCIDTSTLTLQCNRDLKAWSSANNVTAAALHYSVWSLVLSLYTNSDSVIFGSVVSARGLPISGCEEAIGPFINTIPFSINIDWASSCEQHVRRTFRSMVKLQEMASSTPGDGFFRHFDSVMAMEIEMPSFEGFKIQALGESSFNLQTGIPLTVTFDLNGRVRFRYQPSRLDAQDVQLISKLYNSLLLRLTASDDSLKQCITDVSESCYGAQVLRHGNFGLTSTQLSAVTDDLVVLFEKIAVQHPNVVAIKRGQEEMTYAELDRKAAHVAQSMKALVNPGDVVCVCADRSPNWLIATYAVLKLGAVYTPLNLLLPGRIQAINYRVAEAVLFLTPYDSQCESAPTGARCLSVQHLLNVEPLRSFPHRDISLPDSVAYICFTSGSTGTPKGVACRHRSLVAFQKDLEVRLNAQPGQKIAQIMSPAFDGSIHEVFSTLSYGATLFLPETLNDLSHLKECDSAILTPSLARVLSPCDYPQLKQVYLVGEPVPQNICDTWAEMKHLFNMYGPTESTCGATIKRLYPKEPVSIGRPNMSSRIYILDRHRRPCPPNVIGDIYTAGIQVAVGYVAQPVQTSNSFFPDCFYPATEERMYLTGDRGCWTSTGEICCLGRSDRQVKLNGFRVDLNLLEEQILEEIPQLEAVGLVKKNDFLQAAVVPSSTDVSLLRSQLSEKLPVYAVPRILFPMDALPRTAISKVDYSAIMDLKPPAGNKRCVSKHETIEMHIEHIWKETLNLDSSTKICSFANLLEFGGDSLTQLALANRLSKILGYPVQLRHIIEAPTVGDLALTIKQLSQKAPEYREMLHHAQSVSPLEADWLKKYEVGKGTSAFNVSLAWTFPPGTIDRERLAMAWNTAIAKYSILSSYYVGDSAQGWSRKTHRVPPQAELVEEFDLVQTLNRPFDVSADNLIRVLISKSKMVAVLSHLICDLTSLRIVLKDVTSLYSSVLVASNLAAEDTIDQVKREIVATTDLKYWSDTLMKRPLMPGSIGNQRRESFIGRSTAYWLPQDLLHRIERFSRDHHFTLHQIALAATTLALQHETSSIDMILGAPFVNRLSNESEKTGLFLEPLPIRIRHTPLDGNEQVFYFLDSVRQASQKALAHRIPWAVLLDEFCPSSTPPQSPFFDVMVTFHDYRQEELLAIPGLEQLQSWSSGSKFKIMAEFSAYSNDSLLLRLEYDSSCFSVEEINRKHGLILSALNNLITESKYSDVIQSMAADSACYRPGETVEVGSRLHIS